MWWSRTRRGAAPWRGVGLAVLLLALSQATAGCGFRPMYARPGPDAEVPSDRLAAIRILPLPDRIGQQMHNLLRDRLNPGGQPDRPAYLLRVSLSESRVGLGIRKDETATRANLTVSAQYQLQEAETNRVLLRGRSSSTNSYNILENQFATIYSEADARKRALRELSDSIRTRLATYFSQAREEAS